jgi:hypothetical protein
VRSANHERQLAANGGELYTLITTRPDKVSHWPHSFAKRVSSRYFIRSHTLFEMTLCWLAFLVVIFIVGNAEALVWNGDGTDTRWSLQCDFIGRDLKNQISPASQCGSLCKANSPCSHFTWTNFNVSSLPFHFTSFSFVRIIMQAVTYQLIIFN